MHYPATKISHHRRRRIRPIAWYFYRSVDWFSQNPILWLRPLIVVLVLLLAVVLAFSPEPIFLVAFVGLVLGIAAVLGLMRWPVLGLVAVIGTLVVPFQGPSGVNATMGLVVLLLLLWLLDMAVRQRQIKLIGSKPFLPLLILVVIAVLAFGVGQIPWYTLAEAAPIPAQLGGLSLFVLSAGAFMLVANQVRDLKQLQLLVWVFLILGGSHVILRLIPPLELYSYRLYAPGGPGGSLFWTWMVALGFSQAVYNQKLRPWGRVIAGGITLITLYVVVGLEEMRAWNSGWVPALTAIFVIIFAAKPRLAIPAIVVGVFGAMTQLQKLVDFIMIGDNEYSLSTRLEAWGLVWNIAKINPILGLGPANYYYYTPLFPIRGYAVEYNSHSQYVDLIAQTGLLGLAAFLWFFLAVAWLGWRLRLRAPEGFARAYVYAAIGGVAGTLVSAAFGDWVIPFFYNVGLVAFTSSVLSWIFLGGLVVIEQVIERGSQNREIAVELGHGLHPAAHGEGDKL